jgi:hypothetical protein
MHSSDETEYGCVPQFTMVFGVYVVYSLDGEDVGATQQLVRYGSVFGRMRSPARRKPAYLMAKISI